LERVDDWPQQAREAGYCARRLANRLDAEERAVRRFFVRTFGRPTQQQMELFRQMDVERLAKQGVPEKVIAIDLHFKQVSHFARRFKVFHGISFRIWLKMAPGTAPVKPEGFCP
jgi:AraC-like DNA-binding protein